MENYQSQIYQSNDKNTVGEVDKKIGSCSHIVTTHWAFNKVANINIPIKCKSVAQSQQ